MFREGPVVKVVHRQTLGHCRQYWCRFCTRVASTLDQIFGNGAFDIVLGTNGVELCHASPILGSYRRRVQGPDKPVLSLGDFHHSSSQMYLGNHHVLSRSP